jgi:hypothetical protein
MKVVWMKSDQHTEWGLFRVGDVIDVTATGIPAEVVANWTASGFAATVDEPRAKKVKKTAEEE